MKSEMQLPNIWPLFNIIKIIVFNEKKKEPANDSKDKYSWYTELIVRHLRLLTYFFVALIVYYFTFPPYSSLLNDENNLMWYIRWGSLIFIRDQFITFIFYGGWHYILYQSPYSSKMKKLKFNPVYPDESQWQHDRFWTLIGSAISTFYELFMIWFYRKYGVRKLLYSTLDANIFAFYLWILFVVYWETLHFYLIHRLLHPWNCKIFGFVDVGRYLYRQVHYLHHKSYNTGPWTGLSMHPIEHLLYFSCILVPTIFGFRQHVMHLLFSKFYALLAPLPGHDGFDSPGGASYFHYLHHAHFECNYGTPLIPLDRIFGTFESGEKYRKLKKCDSANDHQKC